MSDTKSAQELYPALASLRTLHLELPLYANINFENLEVIEAAYALMVSKETVDVYCVWCEKESVFKNARNINTSGYTSLSSWLSDTQIDVIAYTCTRNSDHLYRVYYLVTENDLIKIGQYPSVADFQIPQAESYRKVLDEAQYTEFTKGIGLAAHGVGIGSFVYLRRIFEDLIEEAYLAAKAANEISEEQYLKSKMVAKIGLLKNYLPDFLVKNKNLYGILSLGIHELSEEECLKYFDVVKIGIEQILDEKITQQVRKDKAAAASKLISDVAKTLKGGKSE